MYNTCCGEMSCEYFNISWIYKNIVGRKPSPISLWHFVATEPERLFAEGLIKTNNRTLIYSVTSAEYTVQCSQQQAKKIK
jgi:hypothetical protein